jgi:hypothetical protein
MEELIICTDPLRGVTAEEKFLALTVVHCAVFENDDRSIVTTAAT